MGSNPTFAINHFKTLQRLIILSEFRRGLIHCCSHGLLIGGERTCSTWQ